MPMNRSHSRPLTTPRWGLQVRTALPGPRASWRAASASAAVRTNGGRARHRCSCGSFGSVGDPELIRAMP